MICISKWFKLTTYPENENEIRNIFERFDVAIEDEWNTIMLNPGRPRPTRITFECHVSFKNFDKMVAYLDNDFTSWARISC